MITLSAEKRTNEKPEALRAMEKIPAVFYGAGTIATSIIVSTKEFTKIWKEAGETTAITLAVGDTKVNVLIHDVQKDPRLDAVTHVDFLVIDMKKEVEVAVPLVFTGVAEAEKAAGGTFVTVLHDLEVRALPADLPHEITVDVTVLQTLEDKILASNVKLPKGVSLVTEGEEVVALVAPFAEEKEESAPMDLSAIEVEKKGKKEDEAAE
ncbi:MAG: 50S ribosomal protein L25 [bacterium]